MTTTSCDDLALAARKFASALDAAEHFPDSPDAADAALRARLDVYMWFVDRGWRPSEADAQSMLSDLDLLHRGHGSTSALPARQRLIRLSREVPVG
jgi:hypothetical protein